MMVNKRIGLWAILTGGDVAGFAARDRSHHRVLDFATTSSVVEDTPAYPVPGRWSPGDALRGRVGGRRRQRNDRSCHHNSGTGNGGYTRHTGCGQGDWHAVRGSESRAAVMESSPALPFPQSRGKSVDKVGGGVYNVSG
jgi:hypothetical protein